MDGRVLICEESAELLKEALQKSTWQLQVCSKDSLSKRLLTQMPFDIAILYYEMKPISGIQALNFIKTLGLDSEVIIVSKSEKVFDAVRAIKAGAYNYIADYDLPSLFRSIDEIMARKKEHINSLAVAMDIFVKMNAIDASIDLNMLSDHFSVSIGYVSKLFSEQIGVTFRKRVRYFRVQAAKNMLEQSDKSIYAISKLSGFSTQRRLSETFVQFEGLPPLRYRQLYKSSKA